MPALNDEAFQGVSCQLSGIDIIRQVPLRYALGHRIPKIMPFPH
jgi:hypothetical protein